MIESIFQFIYILGPAVFYVIWRNKYLEIKLTSKFALLITYIIAIIGLNLICSFIFEICRFLRVTDISFEAYAGKSIWVLLASILAFIEPILEKHCRKGVLFTIRFPKEKNTISENVKLFMLWCYSIVLFCFNFARIFDRTYSGDEAFSVLMVSRNWSQILSTTASDVHPPLYYFILKFVSHFLGHTGYAYHFVSLIAYSLVLIFSILIIRRLFGNIASTLFISLSSLLYNAIRYNVEIRMYSWASFFVLVTFIFFYLVLVKNRYRDYVFMGFGGLFAAYTHYYALISVTFFFISMILYTIFHREKKRIFGMVISCLIAVVGYIYWLFILIETFIKASHSWWMTFYTNFVGCFNNLFLGSNEKLYLYSLLFFSGLLFIYEFGIIKTKWNGWKLKEVVIDFQWKDRKISPLMVWFITGFISIFGTAAVGIWVSYIFRPLFYVKYMYPVAVIAWLLLSISISKVHYKKLLGGLLLICIIWGGIKDYTSLYKKDKEQSSKQEKTLSTIDSIVRENGALLSIERIFYSPKIYYPKNEFIVLRGPELDFTSLNNDKVYCFISLQEISQELEEIFDNNGFKASLALEEGYFEDNIVWIYEVQK